MKKTATLSIIIAIIFLLASNLPAAAQISPDELEGKQIRNEQGEELGTIEEVIMGLNGEIEAVIVEKGGFLGFGGEENRIPWNDLKQGGDPDYLVYIPGREQDSDFFAGTPAGETEDTMASAEQKQPVESQEQAKLDQRSTSPESGEIVVTQPGATVEVDQSEPQVRVKQAAPRVAVQQEPPKVTVTQPAPQITVRVKQPKPEVSIQQQQPEVNVRQEAPKVMVQHEKPEVSVQQQKPQVTIIESKPEVQIDQSSQARVSIEKQQQAQVDIQKQGEPEVEVITGQQQSERGMEDRDRMAKEQQDQERKTVAKIEAANADDWLGKNLVGKNGEKIGTVNMHYLSEDGSSVEYLIIQGDENKLHPVPADLVRIDQDKNRLIADIDKQTLQNSPSFSEQENPELDKQNWSQEIRAYYGEQEGGQNRTE